MKTKKIILIAVPIVLILAAVLGLQLRSKKENGETLREISPKTGVIQIVVSSTGTLLPKNRLEVKPPVNGRIDSILVKEGDLVKKGQTLGWLSSTERAALLDAAAGQGDEKVKYWQDVYKPISLAAPIDGQVIVSTMQPGQTVTAAEAVLVLSDRLIVRAQVDETDIGKIKEGQPATISLDAYPDEKINAKVDHVYYESQTVNNVTIYQVDLVLEKAPEFFRSGMNANIDFVVEKKENALLLEQEAVHSDNGENYVLIRGLDGREPVRQPVTLGLAQDKNVEILSGITADDIVLINSKKYALPKSSQTGKNPFMPQRRPSSRGGRDQGPPHP